MALPTYAKHSPLFPPFHFHHWRAVDDRVRGGASVSHLDPVKIDVHGRVNHVSESGDGKDLSKDDKETLAARFWGNLDIKTLGGAGFASQAYRFGPYPVHLPRTQFAGIILTALPDPLHSIGAAAGKPREFTFVVKTSPTSHIPKDPRIPAPPRGAQLAYQVNFTLSGEGQSKAGKTPEEEVFPFAWSDFKATYRGKEVKEGDPKWVSLDTTSIYEVSLMCRSGFGEQEGDFGVIVCGIWAWEKEAAETDYRDEEEEGCWSGARRWFSWMMGLDKGISLQASAEEEKQRIV